MAFVANHCAGVSIFDMSQPMLGTPLMTVVNPVRLIWDVKRHDGNLILSWGEQVGPRSYTGGLSILPDPTVETNGPEG